MLQSRITYAVLTARYIKRNVIVVLFFRRPFMFVHATRATTSKVRSEKKSIKEKNSLGD